eukprot:6139293-Pleurochrysis_carterae.AAC.1
MPSNSRITTEASRDVADDDDDDVRFCGELGRESVSLRRSLSRSAEASDDGRLAADAQRAK